MNKKQLSKRMKWFIGGTASMLSIIPLVAVSAVACSKEQPPSSKPAITISAQPKNEIIFLNQPENLPTLSVDATTSDSSAQLAYQWYENASNSTTGGTTISGATNSTYTIPQSDAAKTGTKYYYAVVSAIIGDKVTNSINSEISTLIISDKIPPIAITSHSKDQDAIIGQTKNFPTFSVDATTGFDNQQLTYQWYQSKTNSTTDGVLILKATNSSYTVASSNTLSEGKTYFYVKVSGTLNGLMLTEVTSEPMILTISQVPTIVVTTEPQNQNSIVNQTEELPTFSVIATTKNPDQELTYQWYSSSTNSNTTGTIIDGATNSSYTITAEDSKTAGTSKYFYVKVSGTINGVTLVPTTSSPASLTVKALPTIIITTQPTAQTVHANQSAGFPSFSVVATPIDNATFTYQWYSNTTNSTENATAISGATNPSYATSQSDIGAPESKKYFYVQIGGSVGGIKLNPVNSDVVSLTTQAASAITISSQPTAQQIVAKNTNITLSTVVTSTAAKPLTYQWQKSDKNTDDAVWTNIANANNASYSFIENNDYSTVTYYRVVVGQESTTATQTSSLAKVTVAYTFQQAVYQMRIWLSKTTNQESLLNSFFTKSQHGPLGIFNLSSIYGYKFETLPKSNKYTLSFVKKTEENKLPFDVWSVRAVISEAGSISKWNNTTSRYEDPESIPANSVISFYLPYNFRKEETITVGSSSITISPTVSISNNSSQLLIMRDNLSAHIPYAFSANPLFQVSISRFLIGQANPLLIQSSYQWPVLPTFTSSNSNLPAYMIVK